MRAKLLILLSLFLPHTAYELKHNSAKKSFPIVAQEVGIWILVGGFVMCIFWLATSFHFGLN